MVLKGKPKTDYQREYMRKRRSNRVGLTGSNTDIVRPGLAGKLKAVGIELKGNKIAKVDSQAPIYNPLIHRAGDRVMMKSPYSKKLIEMVIPNVDADGHVYEE